MKLFLVGVAEFHASLIQHQWLHSSRDTRFKIGALVLILLAGMVNFEIRDRQWENWNSQSERYFANGSPLVSTTDAAYFLSHARDYQRGAKVGTFEATRLYPEKTTTYLSNTNPKFEPEVDRSVGVTDIPLLSAMITTTADWFTDGDLVLAGNLMIPFTALLTALAIGVMFSIAGYPLEGAVAAAGSGLSWAYLVRTSIGRIDTDQMLLFFVAMCLSFAMLASRENNHYRMLGFSLLTAFTASIAYWWHANGLFLVVVPAVMVAGIYLNTRSIKQAAMALGVFVIAVNPIVFFQTALNFAPQVLARLTGGIFASQKISNVETLIFPHTYTTVAELNRLNFLETLEYMTPSTLISIIGVIGFVVWMLIHPRKGLIFVPFFILGMLSFIAGLRFAFFASPFVWFGVAWLLLSGVRWLMATRSRLTDGSSFFADGAALVAATFLLLGSVALTFDDYTPRPTFSALMTKTFSALNSIASDNGGIITTWWDYGHYAHFHSGLDTFHDPGYQTNPRTHLLARGLTSPNQNELIQIVKFATSQGTAGIDNSSRSLNELNKAIAAAGMPKKPLYLVLTYEMSEWMRSIAKLGRFDIKDGKEPNENILSRYDLVKLGCRPLDDNRLQCRDGLLDIEKGTIDGRIMFGEVAVTRNGVLESVQKRNNTSPWTLIVQILADGSAHFALMHRENWNNSFNTLFHQGRYDASRLELVLDNYPVAMVYRIIQ